VDKIIEIDEVMIPDPAEPHEYVNRRFLKQKASHSVDIEKAYMLSSEEVEQARQEGRRLYG